MPRAEATDAQPDAPKEVDHFAGAFIVRIAALAPQRIIAATVTPLNLGTEAAELTAFVGWEGIATVSTTVGLEVEPGPGESVAWLRFMQLLWAVLGPKTVPEPEAFGPDRWSSIVLSTQELDEQLQHSVVVVVDRASATARLVRSDPARASTELRISADLLTKDAGSVLVEMASRLILKRPWL